MRNLLRGWPGRVLLGVAVMLGLAADLFLSGVADGSLRDLTTKELLMKVMMWPVAIGFAAFGVASAYAFDDALVAKQEARKAAQQQALEARQREQREKEERERHTFSAQVVGIQWLNPVMRRGYPTEWNLLWTLGLAGPNKDDVQVKESPEKFNKVQKVAAPVGDGSTKAPFYYVYRAYTEKISLTLRERYFMEPKYFYTVHAKNPESWRELAGIRIEYALPQRLDRDQAKQYVQSEYASDFSIGKPDMSTSSTPPEVEITQGGAPAGFTSLSRALDYLEQHPDKTVWVMSFDAPTYPKESGVINESCVLLVLAHPAYKTEREPLAWVHRVSTRHARDFQARAGEPSRLQQAWQAALQDAAARAGLNTTDIGYVIHDAGQGEDAANRRIGAIAQAVTEASPELVFTQQSFNTPALLGNLGAGTALTNVALAIAYAHHRNTPVLVAGTTEADTATAMLIRPPANPEPFDPNRNWFRARGEGNAYLPWWGRRFDAPKNLMQGWSE